jgi:hypothetical protein
MAGKGPERRRRAAGCADGFFSWLLHGWGNHRRARRPQLRPCRWQRARESNA